MNNQTQIRGFPKIGHAIPNELKFFQAFWNAFDPASWNDTIFIANRPAACAKV